MLRCVDDPVAPTPDPRASFTRRVFTAAEHQEIPLRTILVTVGVVVAAGLTLVLAWVLRADLLLIAAAMFIAVLLHPPVAWLQRRGLPRPFAASIVFVLGLGVFAGLAYALGEPLVSHVRAFVNDLPHQVDNAQQGRGPIGRLIAWLHLQNWVHNNAPRLLEWAKHLAGPAFSVGAAAFSTLWRILLIAVMSFFMLLDLPKIWAGFLSLLPKEHAARAARVGHDASTGVAGYMLGNLVTSIIAGIVVFISLTIFGVPFASLLAVWVALVDFIPIVGGLLAGLPTVLVALLHSPTAGVAMLVIFLVYQQIENHVLNPIVMSKTVKMSPLFNLLAVLIGATLGGRVGGIFGTLIGALVGIPVGSALQVVIRDLRHPVEVEAAGIDQAGTSP